MSPKPRDRRPKGEETFSPARVDGVLLCAGVGQRLRPLTDTLPKALIPVAGRPLLEHHLRAWHAAGVRRVILVVGYREDQVRQFVTERAGFGLEIEYVTQTERRGTGHALLASQDRVRSAFVLVGYADVFFGEAPPIWATLLAGPQAKIVGASVPDAARYGRLVTEGTPPALRLVAIHEKDGVPSAGLVNAGAYLLPRRVLELLRTIPPSPRGEIELTDGVTAYVAEGGSVEVVPAAQWVDVGTPDHLDIANRMALSSPSSDRTLGAVARATHA